MMYELDRALTEATNGFRAMGGDIGSEELSKLTGRLETIRKIAQFSPTVVKETCRKFSSDCNDFYNLLLADGCTDSAFVVLRISREFSGACIRWCQIAVGTERLTRKDWDRGDVEAVRIGRWEDWHGKHWVELWWGRYDYSYRSNNSCGSVCSPFLEVSAAVLVMQAMVDNGQFLPDIAVIPMVRIA